jgi:integrase
VGKSPDQIRRSHTPKEKAFRNFIEVCGDLFLDKIERGDLTKFKAWWAEKIAREGLTRNSANKDLIHVTSVIRRLAIEHDSPLLFDTKKLTFSEADEKKTRDPIPDDWIRGKILAPGALAGLNNQARGILLGLINTGLRPSECAMLTAKQIILDAPVPHLTIEGVGRKLKSAHAKRKIPLVGVSLEAFKAHPDGFPRYAGSPTLSATVNKYLRENGLLPEGCTLYGLRHSFEDRMLAAGFDERIRRDLLGHSLTRERYGAGAKLEQARDMLQKISI